MPDVFDDGSESDCEIVGVEQIDIEMESSIETNCLAQKFSPISSPLQSPNQSPIKIKSTTKEAPSIVIDSSEQSWRASTPFSLQVVNSSHAGKTEKYKTPPRCVRVNHYFNNPDETIQLSDEKERARAPENFNIPSSSFYSKPIKNESKPNKDVKPKTKQKSLMVPTKKSLRTASRKATENLKKNADDIYEFSPPKDVPKSKRGRKAAPKSIGILIETTNKAPFRKDGPHNRRRLFDQDENNDVEIVEEPTKKSKFESIVNDELTPSTFRTAMMHTDFDVKQRILDNMNKINETTKPKFNSNVSFSYRQSSVKSKAKCDVKPDSTMPDHVSKRCHVVDKFLIKKKFGIFFSMEFTLF